MDERSFHVKVKMMPSPFSTLPTKFRNCRLNKSINYELIRFATYCYIINALNVIKAMA